MDENISISEEKSLNELEEEKEDIEEKEKESKKIFNLSLESFKNNQFKKTISFINKLTLNKKTTYYWQIQFIKLSSYQEIIENKLNSKYYNPIKISKIEKYLKLFNNELNNFIEDINNNQKDENYSSKYEIIITFILRQCNNYSRFCIYQNFIHDCIVFLGLAERLIKKTSDFIYSPDSLHYGCEIFIFLSSLYIISNNFNYAKKYIILCLKLCYKELELRLENNNYLESLFNINKFNDREKEKVESIFLNITICFFHLGVCNENEYNFNSAYESYKQAKWFSKVIPNNNMIEFISTIYNMEKRELLRSQLIEFFKKENNNLIEEPLIIIKKPKFIYNEEENIKKFKQLEMYLNNLKIKEIDDDEPNLLFNIKGKPFSKNVSNVTKTIHVLNYLMKDKFNSVIDKMKKIELHNLNNETKQIIQKKIINIKNDEREKERIVNENKMNIQNYEKEKNKTIIFRNNNNNVIDIIYKNKNISENNNNETSNTKNELKENELLKTKLLKNQKNKTKYKLIKLPNQSKNLSTETSFYSLNKNKHFNKTSFYNSTLDINSTNINNFSSKMNNSKISITSRNKISNKKPINTNYNDIDKIKYNSYIFNKKFQQKRKFLENQFSKELKFQKEFLNCKILPKENNNENFNKIKTQLQCEDFFKKTLREQISLIKEKEILKKEELKFKKDLLPKKIFNKIPTSMIKEKEIVHINKKSSSPEIGNMKFIDNLTSQIENIDITKRYLISSFKRNLIKSQSSRK